jgi:hypothetical protein
MTMRKPAPSALVMKVFRPSICHPPGTRVAVVAGAAGSEP